MVIEKHESAVQRVGEGIGDAIRKVYAPDASADETLDRLIEQLRKITRDKEETKQ